MQIQGAALHLSAAHSRRDFPVIVQGPWIIIIGQLVVELWPIVTSAILFRRMR